MDEQSLTPFELSLSARLQPYAERAVMPVDAAEVAHAVASARPRIAVLWNLHRPSLILKLGMVVALLLAVVAAGLFVGAILRSDGLGRNGLIVFATNGSVAVANPDGSGVRILTSAAGQASFPTWSPDGATIAFWSKSPDRVPATLTLLDPKTGWRTVIMSLNPQSDPAPLAWSPDSRQLAFQAYTGQENPEVLVVRADGTDLRSLAPLLQASDPAWSPDGSQIAFRAPDPADLATVRLYVVDADGTGIRPVPPLMTHTVVQTWILSASS